LDSGAIDSATQASCLQNEKMRQRLTRNNFSTIMSTTDPLDAKQSKDDSVVSECPTNQSDKVKRKSRRWWPFLVAPYVIGVAWHGLHPLASILTGEFSNPRRSYIDENSLDPNHFKRDIRYSVINQRHDQQRAETSLCNLLRSNSRTRQHPSHCFKRGDLEVAKIVPTGSAIAPVSEALVIVVPATSNWLTSQLHHSMVDFVTRLSTPEAAPWLAKTVFIISPIVNLTLQETVDVFLNLNNAPHELPITDGAVIRSLLVLDVQPSLRQSGLTSTGAPELRILPQGRRGILPNLDLVFLCEKIYSGGLFADVSVSPYRTITTSWLAKQSLPLSVKTYLDKLLELLGFEFSLVAGPVPPHASALDRGIESLTIQLVASGNRQRDDAAAANLVTGLEYVVRALSNLHERLHHSTSLYLLSSSGAFVKHEEYLIPNLLLIVPCIVRAATLVVVDIQRFCMSAAKLALLYTLFCAVSVGMVGIPLLLDAEDNAWRSVNHKTTGNIGRSSWLPTCYSAAACLVAMTYVPLFWFSRLMHSTNANEALHKDSLLTVQFLACLLVMYTHVAIAFSHVSLAFSSALVWSLLVAFPRYDCSLGLTRRLLFITTMIAGSMLMHYGILSFDSIYFRYVCLPLHCIMSIIWLG
jgi:glycosylphosphatidylinositol transamidase